jgi:hypothetical protein
MADEHAARVRSLHTERARPAPDLPKHSDDVGVLLADLVAALHSLYRTPPDRKGPSS